MVVLVTCRECKERFAERAPFSLSVEAECPSLSVEAEYPQCGASLTAQSVAQTTVHRAAAR